MEPGECSTIKCSDEMCEMSEETERNLSWFWLCSAKKKKKKSTHLGILPPPWWGIGLWLKGPWESQPLQTCMTHCFHSQRRRVQGTESCGCLQRQQSPCAVRCRVAVLLPLSSYERRGFEGSSGCHSLDLCHRAKKLKRLNMRVFAVTERCFCFFFSDPSIPLISTLGGWKETALTLPA